MRARHQQPTIEAPKKAEIKAASNISHSIVSNNAAGEEKATKSV